MDSMPPATTISDSPVCTACAASATAFNPEPQTLLMVMAATRGSQPPFSAACRAGFWPSPACTTLPRIASSICFASMLARRAASATTLPPSSGAENPARPPWNFPTGVRTADKMTGFSIPASGGAKHYYSELRNLMLRRLSGNRLKSVLLRLVCGWAVQPGNRNVEQPQIDGELATVMVKMVQAHAAQARQARHCKNLLTTRKQLPTQHNLLIANARQRGPRI